MTLNIWLLVASLLLFGLTVFLSFVIVVHYQDVSDKKSEWGYKIVAIIAFTIILFLPLLFAIDAVNTATDGPTNILPWVFRILPFVMLVLSFFILPFGYSLYGSAGNNCGKRFFGSLMKSIIVLAIIIALSVLFYFVLGFIVPEEGSEGQYDESTSTFDVYLISFFSLLGFILIIIFSGVGLAGIPISMISRFMSRPKPVPQHLRGIKKQQFKTRAAKLIDEARKVKRKYSTSKVHWRYDKHMASLAREIGKLEDEFLVFQMGCGDSNYNPLKYIFSLIFGIICCIVSIALIIHYILCPLLDISPFLNIMFDALYNVWDILGVVLMGFLGLYIEFAMVSGVATIGSRWFFGIPIHPLRAHKSTTADILYQCSIMLVTSLGLCSLLLKAFPEQYLHDNEKQSGIEVIFGYTTKMKGFKYIFEYGLWASVILFPISIIVLTIIKVIENKRKNKVSRVANDIKSQMNLVERAAVRKKIKTQQYE